MKCIATLIALAAVTAASQAAAFEVTDHKSGVTTRIDSSDYGMSLSSNVIGKAIGNKHVYGFAAFDYAHNDRENLGAQDTPTSPLSTSAKMGIVGIKYRF